MRCIAEQSGCLAGFKELHADKGTVDQNRELTGEAIGRGNRQSLGDSLETTPHLAHVGFGDLPGGVIYLRELGRGVDLRAAPVISPPDPFADPLKMCIELGLGIVRMLFRHAIPCAPEVQVFALEEGGDEVVLRAEMAVEAGFGDAGFFDHKIDTDSAHAAPVKEF